MWDAFSRVLVSYGVTLPFFLKIHQLYLGEVPVHLWCVSFSWEWVWVLVWLGIRGLKRPCWQRFLMAMIILVTGLLIANQAGYVLFGMFLKGGHLHSSSLGDLGQALVSFLTPALLKDLLVFHGGCLVCHWVASHYWARLRHRRRLALIIGVVYVSLVAPFGQIHFDEQRMSLEISVVSFLMPATDSQTAVLAKMVDREELGFVAKPPAPNIELPDHKRYNLIIYPMESVRASASSSYGCLAKTTPFLDRVQDQGIFFERCYSNAVRSIKALTTMILGIYPYNSRSAWSSLPVDKALQDRHLAGILQRHRYYATFFVNSHISFDNRETFLGRLGYDRYEGSDVFISGDDSVLVEKLDQYFREAETEDRPLLSVLLPSSGHAPYPVKKEAISLKTAFREAERVGAKAPGRLHAYLNAVHHQDQVAEKIYHYLERTGRLDHTILVVVGDHGEVFGEHGALGGLGLHGASLFEESIHVPAWFHHPDLAPRRISEPVQFLDMLPTWLAMLGLPVEETFLGRNVLVETRPQLFLMNHAKRYVTGVLADGYKLIGYGEPGNPSRFFQLFDLERDPFERNPLASTHPAFANLAKVLDRAEQHVPVIQEGYRELIRHPQSVEFKRLPIWDKRILGGRQSLPPGQYLVAHVPKIESEFQLKLQLDDRHSGPTSMRVSYYDEFGALTHQDKQQPVPADEPFEMLAASRQGVAYALLDLPSRARVVAQLESDRHTAPYALQRVYGQSTVYSGLVAGAVACALVLVNPSEHHQNVRVTLRADGQVIQIEEQLLAAGNKALVQFPLEGFHIASITVESDQEQGVVSWLLRWQTGGAAFR